ncbi:MAG TPA: methylated-DNA--[protein]-cysteine S-methyltransferase [Candidatus Dormibacteraeota bacterium]|nr:methylated-DNA--[protein]-cysteine S-methyltransferase [Candidatus Dormibacteraeota bacterium]
MTEEISDDTVVPALRRIGDVRAPQTLLPGVLDAVGIGAQHSAVETDIGTLRIAWTSHGIRAAMRFVSAEEFARWYASKFGTTPRYVESLPPALARGVADVLLGAPGRSRVRFDLRGLTPFEESVLQTALRIPRGEVRPYNWIARRIGRPLAVRAVGTALANNPIPYLIPCHRVVRADGHIGNYGGGGPTQKRAILGWEGVDAAELERMARRGVRFLGSDTTHIVCYPTCRHARRITEPHRVGFGSIEDARAAGYRECKDCTPTSMAA